MMEDIITKIEDSGATANGRLSAAEFNDRNLELENAVTRSGQALAIGNTTQLAESLFLNGTKALSFQDVGVVNAADLRPLSGASGIKIPTAYANMNGVVVSFKPAVNNTGAATVNIGQVAGIGAKPIVLSTNFSALIGGELNTTLYAQIQYDLGGDRWLLLPWSLPSASVSFPIAVAQGGTGATTQGGAQTNLNVPPNTRQVSTTGLLGATVQTLAATVNLNVTASSQPQAEAGVDNTTAMTPLRVAQAIAALGGGGALVGTTSITSTGLTVYNPAVNGASKVIIIATAGGGGSGSPNAKTNVGEMSASGGGGAGGTSIAFYDFNTGATTLDVTVGAGGVGAADSTGANGGLGGQTTVIESDGPASTICQAQGGGGSSGTVSSFGISSGIRLFVAAAGGSATIGTLLIQGGSGQPGAVFADNNTGNGGDGGPSFWGGSTTAVIQAGAAQGATVNSLCKGAGGPGSATRNATGAQNTKGYNGADGVCIIFEFA